MKKLLTMLFLGYAVLPNLSYAENMEKCIKGWASTELGDYAQAVNLFEQCITEGDLSKAHLARTYRNLGITYRRSHQHDKAILSYNKAIELSPVDVIDDYVNRANSYDESGNFEKALADYDTALSIDPTHAEAHYNKGIFYENKKMFDQARKEFILSYQYGLRTELLYDRMSVYGLIKKD